MNYAELVTAVEDYCENSFPTVDMNRFIEQAEQKIYNSVQLPALRKNVTGVTVPSNKYLSCPPDFLSPFSLAVIENYGTDQETYTYLLNKDVNFIREAYPNPTDTGLPLYYCLFGPQTTIPQDLSMMMGPTPNAVYRMELHYYFYPESIVTAGTTWLGDNYDSALLNGTLMATTGDPANHGLSGSLNYKSKNFNLFTTQGYNYRNNPGRSKTNTHYLNNDTYLDESRKTNRISKGYNGNFGMDWYAAREEAEY